VYLGGRDHLSHRLVALGMSERGAVLVLYGISGALGALGLLALHLGFWLTLAVGALFTVAIILFGIFLAQVRVYAEEVQRPTPRSGRWAWLRPEGWLRAELAAMALDVLLICVSYLLAYLLKYENSLDVPYLQQFAESLPYVLVIKLTLLVLSGAYRPMWRYFSTADAVHLGAATFVGSALSVVAISVVIGFDLYSRSVFVIDWLLLTALLVGTRISFALLGDWFARLPRAENTRVLILGADDHGDLVLRGLVRDPTFRAVGFLDVDANKRGRRLRGVPVLGTPRDVLTVAVATGAHEVVVATPLAEGPEHARFVHLCDEMGIVCRDAAAFFRQHLPADQPTVEAGV
jgi:UDP-GlcNAc:undecaprenyl-phosphate GlcNAc-1-phosphate transferase